MRRGGRWAAWLCLAVAIAGLSGLPAQAEDAAHPSVIHVLGPRGRPLESAGLVRARETVDKRPVFDAEAPLLGISDEQGRILVKPAHRKPERKGRFVVFAPGLAATLVPAQTGAVSVRLLPAKPSSGAVRVIRREASRPEAVIALPGSSTGDLAHRSRIDAKGRFALPALYDGSWRLFLRRADGRLQPLGDTRAGGDLGEQRPAYKAGLRGQVLDAHGTREQPVPKVTVRFHPLPGGGAEGFPAMDIQTDAEGRFLATGLAPGVYGVTLEDRTWAFDDDPPRVQAERDRVRLLDPWFARRRTLVRGRVLDPDGRPLQDVTVRLLVDPAQPPPSGGYGTLPEPVMTTPDGAFTVRGVTPAEGYRLLAARKGYSPWVSNPFRVDRAEPTKLRDVRLRKGWRLEVRVRDERGDPVADAEVVATAATRPSAADDTDWSAAVRTGKTNEQGRAVLVDLPEDDVLCRVRAPGKQVKAATVKYPRVDDHRRLDITLLPGVKLTGNLVVPDDGPSGPFLVRAVRRDGRASVEVKAASDGTFVFPNLGETAMDLEVWRGSVVGGGGERITSVEHVVPGVEDHVEILLPTLHAFAGAVYDVQPDGPKLHIVVEARRYDPRRERHVWHLVRRVTLQVDDDVVPFEVTGLPQGRYTARAVQGDIDSDAVAVQVDEEAPTELELLLPAGARIAGTVLDEEDTPLLGARVRLIRLHGEDPIPLHGEDPLLRSTDERGDFVFDGVAPGVWRLEATEAERTPAVHVVRVREGEVVVLDEVRLDGGGTLIGKLQDKDGRPLDGAHVEISRYDGEDEPHVSRTDHTGTFQRRHLRPGTYRVLVTAETVSGGPRIEALAEVHAGKTTTVPFTAGDEGIIEGLVTRDGRPVAGALVDLIHAPTGGTDALRRHRAVTDVDGRFVVERLRPGPYRVVLQSGAFRTQREIRLDPDDHLQVELEAHAAVLRGTVETRGGASVPGAWVEAVPLGENGRPVPNPRFRAEGRTDPSGAFILRGLPVGTYTVSVSAVGLPPGRYEGAESDLPGAAFDIEVVLGRGGDLNLQVRDQDDRGVTGARVWLEDANGVALHRAPYVTGSNGRLRIDGVPPGELRVRVHARGLGRPGLQRVEIEEGRQTDLAVIVREAGAIHLRVGAEDGDPAFRTRIDILRAETGELVASRRPLSPSRPDSPWGFVPGTGDLTVGDLEPGDYVALISAGRQFQPARVGVRVTSGDVAHVGVTLRRK